MIQTTKAADTANHRRSLAAFYPLMRLAIFLSRSLERVHERLHE